MDYDNDIPAQPCASEPKHSEQMALVSMILGVIAVLTSGCIYLSIVCGALGIMFALLSRGGCMDMTVYGKAGLTLSAAGLILAFLIFIALFFLLLYQYGGIDGLLQTYMEAYNADTLEELYKAMEVH